MSRFNLKINTLKHGWADLSLSISEDTKTLYFENVPFDTIYDILESALRMAGGIDSAITFYNCSQRDYLTIRKMENHFCQIEIDNSHLDLSIKEYCKAVLRMFDKFVFEFSIDDYTKNWGGFPKDDLEKLRTKYHAL